MGIIGVLLDLKFQKIPINGTKLNVFEPGRKMVSGGGALLNQLFNLNVYPFRFSNSIIFLFTSLPVRGQHLKERICFSVSKHFFLNVDPILKRFVRLRQLFLFVNMAGHRGEPVYLKVVIITDLGQRQKC